MEACTNVFSSFAFRSPKEEETVAVQDIRTVGEEPALLAHTQAGHPHPARARHATAVCPPSVAEYRSRSSKKEGEEIEDLGNDLNKVAVRRKRGDRGSSVRAGINQGAPANWQAIIDDIRCMRADRDAPVDQMGTHQLADEAADKQTQRFQSLVAAMISSQTRDSVTAAAMKRLHALPNGLSVQGICDEHLTVDQLAETLKPVGFYRQKAKNLKEIAQKLAAAPYNGCIPSTFDDLLKLPGVGPKVALLVLWVAFGKGDEGLIVDTNVRRVCCRLGWAPEGSNPEQVRAALETWLPKSLWPEISFLFVGFGQQMMNCIFRPHRGFVDTFFDDMIIYSKNEVCKPTNPRCGACRLKETCPSALVHDQNERPNKKKHSKE